MATLTHTPKNSSHVKSFSYDDATREMSVVFQSERSPKAVTVIHCSVPQEAFDNWVRFPSAGKFYHAVVKKYPRVKPVRVEA